MRTAKIPFYVIEGYDDEICDYASVNVYPAVKRVLDLLFIVLMAPFALVLIGLCALMIKWDGGTALYSQPRVGKDGTVYRLWKLRTMVPSAETVLENHLKLSPSARAEWEKMQKLRDDPRITKVGSYLRKYSLDELPQLYNVFLGDMSLVGPRPMLPEQQQYYPGRAYFDLRPGLTGLWQISERNGCAFIERALYDTRYSVIVSLSVDLKIMWRTLFVVLRGSGM